MASLKEIKGRISSVKSTLKITSAMKMVASAKLHKAQQAAERCAAYEAEMADILARAAGVPAFGNTSVAAPSRTVSLRETPPGGPLPLMVPRVAQVPEGAATSVSPENIGQHTTHVGATASDGRPTVAIVAFSSNTSLCGGFNTNIIKLAKATIAQYGRENVVLYAVGKKMSEALAKDGLKSQADYTDMAQHPAYGPASALAQELIDGYNSGRFSKVVLVWSHMVSTASQKPTVETLLPFGGFGSAAGNSDGLSDDTVETSHEVDDNYYIIEPGREKLLEELTPQVLRLKVYSVLLDSNAAEHAARTVAMQTATDNGNDILADLTLEYNKGRQAKITSEILDLAGGAQQN